MQRRTVRIREKWAELVIPLDEARLAFCNLLAARVAGLGRGRKRRRAYCGGSTRKLEGPYLLLPVLGYELVPWEGWTAWPEGRRDDRTPRTQVPVAASSKSRTATAAPRKETPGESGTVVAPEPEESGVAGKACADQVPQALQTPAKEASRPKLKRLPRTGFRVDVDASIVEEMRLEAIRLDISPEEVAMLALRRMRRQVAVSRR